MPMPRTGFQPVIFRFSVNPDVRLPRWGRQVGAHATWGPQRNRFGCTGKGLTVCGGGGFTEARSSDFPCGEQASRSLTWPARKTDPFPPCSRPSRCGETWRLPNGGGRASPKGWRPRPPTRPPGSAPPGASRSGSAKPSLSRARRLPCDWHRRGRGGWSSCTRPTCGRSRPIPTGSFRRCAGGGNWASTRRTTLSCTPTVRRSACRSAADTRSGRSPAGGARTASRPSPTPSRTPSDPVLATCSATARGGGCRHGPAPATPRDGSTGCGRGRIPTPARRSQPSASSPSAARS